jgi:hypothetical protein
MRRIRFVLVVTTLLFLFGFCSSVSAIRNVSVASYVFPNAPGGVAHFGGNFAYSGGVSPAAREVRFLDSSGRPLPTEELNIVFRRIGSQEYVGITSGNETYELAMPSGMACPLGRYIARNATIAFTVPSRIDNQFFSNNRLVPYKNTNAYIAREFSNTKFADFLKELDLDTSITGPLPNNLRTALMNEINSANQTHPVSWSESYVNADFHVTYSAYLISKGGRNIVDIAGLPLRYYWSIAPNGKAAINTVHVFSFPSTERGLLYEGVIFFQNAAVFKQFNQDAKSRFTAFTSAACSRAAPPPGRQTPQGQKPN